MKQIAVLTSSALPLPALVAAAGDKAGFRLLEFFAAQIRNPNTRRAYARAAGDFFVWCGARESPTRSRFTSRHGSKRRRKPVRRPRASSSASPRYVICSIGLSSGRSCRRTRPAPYAGRVMPCAAGRRRCLIRWRCARFSRALTPRGKAGGLRTSLIP